MLTVLNTGEIRLTRGDTARLNVALTDDNGQPYTPAADDVLTLTVKREYEDEEPVIEKKITGSTLFHIKPEDTKSLAFGKYKYDVQVTTPEGDNYTPIDDKIFNITREVG